VGIPPCGFIANGGEILPEEIMGIGDVGWSTCRVFSENVAKSKSEVSRRWAVVVEKVANLRWGGSEVVHWELRKSRCQLVSNGLIEMVCCASVVDGDRKVCIIRPDRHSHLDCHE